MAYNLIDYNECPKVLSDFLFYISTIKNLSINTVNGYYVDLRLFFRYIKSRRYPEKYNIEQPDEIDISDVDIDLVKTVTSTDIYEYLNYVMRSRDNTAPTRARKLACLRTYFKYLNLKANLISEDPVKNIDVPTLRKVVPKYLSLEESIELLNAVEDDKFYSRNYCILTLFLNCGMRLSELCGINILDVRDDTIRIIGKGNKERLVYLNKACLAAIERWLEDRKSFSKPIEKEAMFLSSRGTRITTRRVEQIVDEALQKAGLAGRGYSAHKLRHTAATLMYQYGDADMLTLKEILGHAHVSTTEIYTHISSSKLKDAAAASPLSGITPPERHEKSDEKEND